jgi:hypothetical protein
MRHSPHSNLYPVGTSPYQDPSCSSARAQGSGRMGPFYRAACCSQPSYRSHIPPWNQYFGRLLSAVLITPSEWRP